MAGRKVTQDDNEDEQSSDEISVNLCHEIKNLNSLIRLQSDNNNNNLYSLNNNNCYGMCQQNTKAKQKKLKYTVTVH